MAAVVGIAAALIAYGISPTVRHAVGHAEHSVKHTVSNIFDHDRSQHKGARNQSRHPKSQRAHSRANRLVAPARTPLGTTARR
jgi:hypothetical protein